MIRILAAFVLLLAASTAAHALPVGGPGASLYTTDHRFSIMGGAGYVSRQVRGDDFSPNLYDEENSVRLLARAQYSVLPWLSPMFTLGLGDRSRDLIDFDGGLGVMLGLGLRIDPLIQRESVGFGVGVVLQSSYERSSGNGRFQTGSPVNLITESSTRHEMTAQTWHNELSVLFSRKDGRVTFYGGPKLDWNWTYYNRRADAQGEALGADTTETTRPADWIGIVLGADYDVTPQVFFTLEMENFHQDSIYLLVGGRY